MQDTITISKQEYVKLVGANRELGRFVFGGKKFKTTKKETLKNLCGIWNGAALNVERELKNIRDEWRNDFT